MGPLIGKWKRTPLWLQALGRPPLRRHIVWAHSDEWEYADAATVNALEAQARAALVSGSREEQS